MSKMEHDGTVPEFGICVCGAMEWVRILRHILYMHVYSVCYTLYYCIFDCLIMLLVVIWNMFHVEACMIARSYAFLGHKPQLKETLWLKHAQTRMADQDRTVNELFEPGPASWSCFVHGPFPDNHGEAADFWKAGRRPPGNGDVTGSNFSRARLQGLIVNIDLQATVTALSCVSAGCHFSRLTQTYPSLEALVTACADGCRVQWNCQSWTPWIWSATKSAQSNWWLSIERCPTGCGTLKTSGFV